MCPSRLCSVPRCGKLLPEGQLYIDGCAKCAVRKEENKPWGRKGTRLQFYGTVKWQKIVLVKKAENPVCEYCENALMVDVDHIVPATKHNPQLWFAWDNLASTCTPCHRRKERALTQGQHIVKGMFKKSS